MRKKTNLLITLALAVLCIGLLGAWIILRQKGNSQNLSSVKETETFTVGEPGAQNTIQISPDGIGVIEADCRDQICVKQGIRSHGPEPIVCLPHKLSIRFKDSTESSDRSEGTDDNQALDAVTGR